MSDSERDDDDDDDASFAASDDNDELATTLACRRERLAALATAISLDEDTAGALLRHCGGSEERVLERYLDDADALLREAGLRMPPAQPLGGGNSDQEGTALAAVPEDEQPLVTLQRGDEVTEVALDVARRCETIAKLLDDTDTLVVPIPTACVGQTPLVDILRFCTELRGGATPSERLWARELLPSMVGAPGVAEMPVDASERLLSLLRAAAYLGQPQLLELALHAAADHLLRRRGAAEIRAALGLAADLTLDEARAAEQEPLLTPVGTDLAVPVADPPPLLDDDLMAGLICTLDAAEIRVVKGSCAMLRTLGRQVLCSVAWQARHLPVLELLQLDAPLESIRARLRHPDVDATAEATAPSFPQQSTPLGLAVMRKDAAAVRVLLEHGAQPNQRHYRLQCGFPWPLQSAVLDDAVELVAILLQYGAIHAGLALLHMARSERMASALIDAGLDVNEGLEIRSGTPPVIRATGVSLLGVDEPMVDDHAYNVVRGFTPLHAAAGTQARPGYNHDVIVALLAAGASVEARAIFAWIRETMEFTETMELTVLEYAQRKHSGSDDRRALVALLTGQVAGAANKRARLQE